MRRYGTTVLVALFVLSLAANFLIGRRAQDAQRAVRYAFGDAAWTVTKALDSALGSLGDQTEWEKRKSWAGTLQMVETARNHAEAAANLKSALEGNRALIAQQFHQLSFDLAELSFIVGRLTAGEDRDQALIAVRNWVAIFEKTNWPKDVQDTEQYWEGLHQSLGQLLSGTHALKLKCMSMHGNNGPSQSNPVYRYACE